MGKKKKKEKPETLKDRLDREELKIWQEDDESKFHRTSSSGVRFR